MKKTFAVVLAAMMLIAAFAGCTTKTVEPSTSPVTEESSPVVSEAPETSEAPVESPEAPVNSETPVESPETSTSTNG